MSGLWCHQAGVIMNRRPISKAFFPHRYDPYCLALLVILWEVVGHGGMKLLTMRLDMESGSG